MQALQVYTDCPGVKWVNVNSANHIANAFIGGVEGTYTLYHCRFYLNGNIVVGKAILSNGLHSCWVPVDGKEVERYDDFEILTNPGGAILRYTATSSGLPIPNDAVIVGRLSNGNLMHMSRGMVNNVQTLGKVDNGYCYLPYQNREIFSQNYEILTCSGSEKTGGSTDTSTHQKFTYNSNTEFYFLQTSTKIIWVLPSLHIQKSGWVARRPIGTVMELKM